MIPRPTIADIAPYVGGEAAILHPNPARLMSNEGALGASPMAMAAYTAASPSMGFYPEGDSRTFRAALARIHGLTAANIIASNGSDELISLLCAAYCSAGDEVLYSRHGFLVYPIAARAAGATPVTAAEVSYTASVEALLQAITPRTKILFLANPNNPTATYLGRAALKQLRENLRPDIVLVLDAAYAEYATNPDYTAGHEMVEKYGNVVVLHTFSKFYAMAGLRLGWGYFPPAVAATLNKIRPPFNVNKAAQAAGVAALSDTAHSRATLEHNTHWRGVLLKKLTAIGLPPLPSQANFIAFDCGSPQAAETLYARLCGEGVYVRRIKAYGLPQFLRLTIGQEKDLQRFLAVVEKG